MKISGFMIDSARCLESRDYYRRFIRFCAAKGLNTILWHFSDDQGLSLDFPSEPGLADAHAYSSEEMHELVKFAEHKGVTIIPELETLGHSRYITRDPRYQHLSEADGDFTAICPLHPETRALMKRLLADVAAIFPSPWIHVGLDEIKLGGHPLTEKALQTKTVAGILAEYTQFIYGEVRALDRRMIMWVDQNSYDTGFIADVPRDILIAVWQYHSTVTPDLAQRLLDDGFDVLLCPGLITYDQQAYPGSIALPNIERMTSFQRLKGKGKVVGALTTIWTPMRYLHDVLWPSMAVAADAMLEAGDMDVSQSIAMHIRDYHGAEPSQAIINALVESFEIAPERKEYLSILNAEAIEAESNDLSIKATQWVEISEHIAEFLPRVKRERAAFETMQEFTSWMAYLYRRAAYVVAEDASNEGWEPIVREGHQWITRLEQIWDSERFADDHRKFSPIFAWEEKEYLLINFRKSLKVTADMANLDLITTN